MASAAEHRSLWAILVVRILVEEELGEQTLTGREPMTGRQEARIEHLQFLSNAL